MFPPKAAPFGGAGVRMQGALPKMAGWRKGWDCEGWRAWRARFGLRTQCRCALLRPPAVADSCPVCAGQSCQRKGFPDFWGGNTEDMSHMQTGKRFLNALGPATCLQAVAPTAASSRNSLPALSAARRCASDASRKVCLVQTSSCGTREKENAARPTGISSRNSRPALSAAAVVQVMQAVQHALCKRDAADARRSNGV